MGAQHQPAKLLPTWTNYSPSPWQRGPPQAAPYVSVPDLLLGELHLNEGPHGGEELPPGPVLYPFVLLDVLLHTANGQVLDLGWGGGGAQQVSVPSPARTLPTTSPAAGLLLWTPVQQSPSHPCPQPPSIPQRVGGREPGPGSTALGTNCSTVIRNNFICFICCLIISSALA